MKLTAKQQAWIDYYKQGHTATEAARLAGHYIKDRDAVLEAPRIADMKEINAFWTEIMRDETAERRDRLKASELRARSMGAFLDRQEVTISESKWFKDD